MPIHSKETARRILRRFFKLPEQLESDLLDQAGYISEKDQVPIWKTLSTAPDPHSNRIDTRGHTPTDSPPESPPAPHRQSPAPRDTPR